MASNTARRELATLLTASARTPVHRLPGPRCSVGPACIAAFSTNNTRSATSSSTSTTSTTGTTASKPAYSAAKPASYTSSTSTTAKPASSSYTSKPATSSASSSPTPAKRTITPSWSTTAEPPPPTARSAPLEAAASQAQKQRSLTSGLGDQPPELDGVPAIDWTRSYHGLGSISFTPEQGAILLAPVVQDDVEVKPDGIVYLPEIKYRRILNRAFGPGGWGLAPRGESIVTGKLITREYGLIVQGRLVSIARGEQQYFDPEGIPTATEGCKSNALMRCCKDLGIASELWDPRFIRKFTSEMTKEMWVEHVTTKKKRKMVLRKDDSIKYPFKESKMGM
ncbi:mitochondrial genome maintenance MGM101-domain-containing protein [Massariosphaeria phaeospora]|uniref:Mitochondrial genome maintenance protein MGM101 n=1 Tax=Massariosphaeria phaeospora TaxID=100035 RepID=A0A7C8I6N7_9PLEO|nr:mitochondrial genome maintenance MGM101-domain-containing protein [Massariosphaeria phaeospora]